MTIPDWIKIKPFDRTQYQKALNRIVENNLNTVCLEGDCPNRYECFTRGTATFMLMGDVCTRNCTYCNIKKGKPLPLDLNEPMRIADAIRKMKLSYAVITCVTRDDLIDGGAEHFAQTIKTVRRKNPECQIEVLISDLQGNPDALSLIVESGPDVLVHNLESVKEVFGTVRPKGDYARSLRLLKKAKELNPNIKVKSGFMLGLGESHEQIKETLIDLKNNNCDIVSVGQYLQPSRSAYPVKKYYLPSEFDEIKVMGEREIGIDSVVAGPLIRSSYRPN